MTQQTGIGESSDLKIQLGFALRVVGVALVATAGWFQLERQITEVKTDAATALAQAKAEGARQINDLRREMEIERLPKDAGRDHRIQATENHITELFERHKETQKALKELERLCVIRSN
jgi:arginine/lysine/ornithine decarboxylase